MKKFFKYFCLFPFLLSITSCANVNDNNLTRGEIKQIVIKQSENKNPYTFYKSYSYFRERKINECQGDYANQLKEKYPDFNWSINEREIDPNIFNHQLILFCETIDFIFDNPNYSDILFSLDNNKIYCSYVFDMGRDTAIFKFNRKAYIEIVYDKDLTMSKKTILTQFIPLEDTIDDIFSYSEAFDYTWYEKEN